MGAFAQLPVNKVEENPKVAPEVSMGAFAQLPVNVCCRKGRTVGFVSMGAFAQLPVNNAKSDVGITAEVSMGAFAQLPVNDNICITLQTHCFNGRLCPTPCQLCYPFIRLLKTKFQWAPLPNSLSTLYIVSTGIGTFQWAPLPNSLSTLLC